MKRIKYVLFSVLVFCFSTLIVNAAPSATLTVSSNTIENGKQVTATVTLKETMAWNVKIISAGNTNGCTQTFVDVADSDTTKRLSVTCKANSVGAISFTMTGSIANSKSEKVNISGSKRVTVVAPRVASKNNYLASLSVDGYELTPVFDEEISNYTVTVPSTVNKIKLEAKVKDKYASLTGTGEFEVNEGGNNFVVTVKAENGVTRDYNVNVVVEDIDPIVVKVDGKDYTILKNFKNVEAPVLFTETTTMIGDKTIPAFNNETTKIMVVVVRDSEGKEYFAVKNNDTYTMYKNVVVGNVVLYIKDMQNDYKNYEVSSLKLGEYDLNAYVSKDNKDFYLVYGLNMNTNEEAWYKYDSKENTLQRYEAAKIENIIEKNDEYLLVIIIFGVGLILAVIVAIMAIVVSNRRVKRIIMNLKSKNNVIVQDKKSNDKKNTNKDNSKALEETKEFNIEDVVDRKKANLDNTIEVESNFNDEKIMKKSNKKKKK